VRYHGGDTIPLRDKNGEILANVNLKLADALGTKSVGYCFPLPCVLSPIPCVEESPIDADAMTFGSKIILERDRAPENAYNAS
jgi:hypothetical protein